MALAKFLTLHLNMSMADWEALAKLSDMEKQKEDQARDRNRDAAELWNW